MCLPSLDNMVEMHLTLNPNLYPDHLGRYRIEGVMRTLCALQYVRVILSNLWTQGMS